MACGGDCLVCDNWIGAIGKGWLRQCDGFFKGKNLWWTLRKKATKWWGQKAQQKYALIK
jgi:hypothetical protein